MTSIISIILIGLILFFCGVILTSCGMKRGSFENFKELVNKIIKNQFVGIIIGIIISIILNNSSLVAVSALLLVNAKLISGRKAFGIIAGSTIALQILTSVELGVIQYAAILLCIASVLYIIIKSRKKTEDKKAIISIILGYIIIIIGMNLLKSGMEVCLKSTWMSSMLADLESNFMINMVWGLFLSGLCWSYYNLAGYMIALASVGIIDIQGAAQIMLGSCLGIIIPVILAGIFLNKEAKKTVCYYLLLELLITVCSIPLLEKYTEEVLRISTNLPRQICLLYSLLGMRNIFLILIFMVIAAFVNMVIKKKSNKGKSDVSGAASYFKNK